MSDELCEEGVTRQGEFQPCDKTAVAMRMDPEENAPYPVCAYHARGDMVPLSELLRQQSERDAQIAEKKIGLFGESLFAKNKYAIEIAKDIRAANPSTTPKETR